MLLPALSGDDDSAPDVDSSAPLLLMSQLSIKSLPGPGSMFKMSSALMSLLGVVLLSIVIAPIPPPPMSFSSCVIDPKPPCGCGGCCDVTAPRLASSPDAELAPAPANPPMPSAAAVAEQLPPDALLLLVLNCFKRSLQGDTRHVHDIVESTGAGDKFR